MRVSDAIRRLLSLLLAVCMVLSYIPVSILAVEEEICSHHSHDGNCGYVKAVEGQACGHGCTENCVMEPVTACIHNHEEEGCIHTDAAEAVPCDHEHGEGCNYVPAQGEVLCSCEPQRLHSAECASVLTEGAECDCGPAVTHAEGCEPREAVAEFCGHTHGECSYREAVQESWSCGHVCTVDSGCIAMVCGHVCPEDNCGFVKKVKGKSCSYVCDECNPKPVCDCTEKCKELSGSCPVCGTDFSACIGKEAKQEKKSIAVDFMEYLEDPVIPLLFQSTEDINVREYLINAFGISAEIPFVCEPAVVAFGRYSDGDTLPITITAGEGYEGSVAVTAEVYHAVPVAASNRATVTVKILKDGQEVASRTARSSEDLNDLGEGYPDKLGKVTLDANVNYTLNISYGAPYSSENAYHHYAVVDIYATGDFREVNASSMYVTRSLNVSGFSGMNQYGSSGTATCNVSTNGYGTYTIMIKTDSSTVNGFRYISLPLVFQNSGKEGNKTETVPNGSNITMQAKTEFPASWYTFEWSKGGVKIEGASGDTYTAATAKAGEQYVATIRRKSDSATGCTGSESWTHTFTVSNDTRTPPTGKTVTYTGSAFQWQDLIDAGHAGDGYYYGYPVGDYPVFFYEIEEYWNDNRLGENGKKYINAGTYTLDYYLATEFYLATKAGTVTFTIEKANPTINSAPTAVTGLKYDGTPKTLVNAGSATNGTMQYSLDGSSWSEKAPAVTDVGTYIVYYRVKGANRNYNDLTDDSYKLTVAVGAATDNTFTKVTPAENLVYNGAEQTLLTAEAKYGTVSYALGTNAQTEPTVFTQNAPTAVNAGTYYVWYRVEETDSYNAVAVGCKTVTIAAKEITASLSNLDKDYDGTSDAGNVRIKLTGLCSTDDVSTTATIAYGRAAAGADIPIAAANIALTGTHAGNYRLKDSNAQGVIEVLSAAGTIHRRSITVSGITAQDKTYDGTVEAVLDFDNAVLSGKLETEDLTVTAVGTFDSADAGENRTVTISGLSLVGQNNVADNYVLAENGQQTETSATINKAHQTNKPAGVTAADETIKGKVDGQITGVLFTMEYRAEGETAYTPAPENASVITGLAAGKYYIRYKETANYNASEELEVIVSQGRMLKVYLPAEQDGYTLTASAEEVVYNGGVTLTYQLAAGYTQGETFAVTATGGVVTDNLDGTYTISGILEDTTVSVAGISDITAPTAEIIVAANTWSEFLETITFNRFFKATQTVTVTAEDAGSGVKSIEYYLSHAAMTGEQVKAVTGWETYNGSFSVEAENKYVVYTKVTDNAGNVLYLSSDGLVMDKTKPVISGVANGGTYYTTQKIVTTDTVADLNTLNTLTLNGESFDGTIPGDRKAFYAIEATDKAGNATLYKISMKPISDLSAGLPDDDSVKVTDKADIEAVKKTASDVLNNQSANATTEEENKLKAIIEDCNDLLNLIEEAEEIIELIDAMPDASKTEPDDKDAIDAYDAAAAAYDDPDLSAAVKRMVGQKNKEKLDAMWKSLTDYEIVKQSARYHVRGSKKTLTFTANGYFGNFTGIEVDGKTVKTKYYEAKSGSTVITLKSSYLDSLKTGKHTIRVNYTNGSTDGEDIFRIYRSNGNPSTGDDSNMELFTIMAVVSLLCMAMMVTCTIRKKGKHQR